MCESVVVGLTVDEVVERNERECTEPVQEEVKIDEVFRGNFELRCGIEEKWVEATVEKFRVSIDGIELIIFDFATGTSTS